ncbi:hypothetical protein HaLaN_22720, partial [Haematococcus lacustris]
RSGRQEAEQQQLLEWFGATHPTPTPGCEGHRLTALARARYQARAEAPSWLNPETSHPHCTASSPQSYSHPAAGLSQEGTHAPDIVNTPLPHTAGAGKAAGR